MREVTTPSRCGHGTGRTRHAWPTYVPWVDEGPIAFNAGDANLYRYVGNSPAVLADPFGQKAAPPMAYPVTIRAAPSVVNPAKDIPARRALVLQAYRAAHDAVARATAEVEAVEKDYPITARSREKSREIWARLNRWFGGVKAGQEAVLNKADLLELLTRLRQTQDGFQTPVVIRFGQERPFPAEAEVIGGVNIIVLYRPFWEVAGGRRRQTGIILHEMTHLFARSDDAVIPKRGNIYLHERGGVLRFAEDPPEYEDKSQPEKKRGGIFPSPGSLLRLADAYEGFLEQYYIK